MILHAEFDGGADPFEGSRDLVLRGLPADARVLAARATITPVDPSGGRDPFAEEIRFPATSSGPGAAGTWGATQVRGTGFTEIDFHARRTLAGFSGSDLSLANLQIDLGGSFVAVDSQGGFAPGSPLALPNDGVVPGVASSRVRLSRAGFSPAVVLVRVRSLPTNVTLALSGRPALFFQAGELGVARTTVDFGAFLAGFLAEGGPIENGAYALPFVLRSDSIARLRVAIEIEYLRTTAILPPGLPEAKLAYDLATVPRAGSAPLEVALPAAAVPVAAASAGKIVGPFAATRIAWGPLGDEANAATGTVPITPTQSAAQPLALPDRPDGYAIVAVDLRLAALDRQVKLTLDLRADDSGKPGADSLLAAAVPFERSRTGDGGETWFSVELPRPLTLQRAEDRKAWLLLQSAEGEAAWSVGAAGAGAVPLQASADGGFSYRAAVLAGAPTPPAPLAAQLRLRERPAGFRMPLVAQLGAGADAVRVDLSRLSPLGKVSFELSIPEIAAGLSAALDKAQSTGGPGGGERLVDPAFAHWGTQGDEIGSPRPIPLGEETAAPLIAFAPDGRTAFGAVENLRSGAVHLVAWDTETLVEDWRLLLDFGSNEGGGLPIGLAVDPAGRFVYLLQSAGLTVVDLGDLVGPRLLGAPIAVAEGAFSPSLLAISNDGARLAVAGLADSQESGPKIALFDAELLVDLVRQGTATAARLRTIDLESDPIDLAFSEDGARLYVLNRVPEVVPGVMASAEPNCRLSAYDLRTAASPVHVPFDGMPRALGRVAESALLVLHPNRLDRYDAQTLALAEPSLPLPSSGFAALAVEPGGARALLVGASGLLAIALLPAGMQPVSVPSGFGSLGGIAVSPLGDRAAAVPFSDAGFALNRPVQVIPLGTPHPLDWTATAGRALPFSLSGTAGRGVLLGQAETAELSTQHRLPTTPLGPSALSQVVAAVPGRPYELSFFAFAQGEARAEVLWRSASGVTLGIETLPLAARIRTPTGGGPTLHRGRFTAPAETVAAEVRFVAEDGLALLRDASFREPANALAAGDLRGAAGMAWQQQPALSPGFRIAAVGSGSRVSNAGAASVTLRQEVAATPGAPFELRLLSRRESGPSPRVDLRFLAADGTEVGAPVGIEIPTYGFDNALALGTIPANTAHAEVLLTVPAGSSVRIDAIELQLVPHVRIPLTFLAEASGELSVIGGTIAWDLADANAPRAGTGPRPGTGPQPAPTPLPAPTPPPGAPDDCGCDDESAPPPQVSPVPEFLPVAMIEIKGIGPRRAEILRSQGVASVSALLAADPRELARVLPGVSEKMAVDFIRQARRLVG
ncbi:MAG TPA: helix-hairpin-helix domain-containing protein [Thermoanaerobaculia bacterium]|jgi:hypothetical protein|nr:helix-hairpin-helix domain-containing protein [Thermoanaerobaculia bacterium]